MYRKLVARGYRQAAPVRGTYVAARLGRRAGLSTEDLIMAWALGPPGRKRGARFKVLERLPLTFEKQTIPLESVLVVGAVRLLRERVEAWRRHQAATS